MTKRSEIIEFFVCDGCRERYSNVSELTEYKTRSMLNGIVAQERHYCKKTECQAVLKELKNGENTLLRILNP